MTRIRTLTPSEVEKIRLILSTYQDGTGMLAQRGGATTPGWRDFERAVALALNGEAQESKFVFDVLVRDTENPGSLYGLSCKSKDALDMIDKKGRAYLELSNSAKKFWDYLATKGITRSNYKTKPQEAGNALVELVMQWHREAATNKHINLSRSSYLTLSYNKAGLYQLHQLPLKLPNAQKLRWHFPPKGLKAKQGKEPGLKGEDAFGTVFEWYGESGGQLKYYPLVKSAVWASERFRLEPLPERTRHGVITKVETYFPELWARANQGL
jgi:hypothetical protein